MQPRPAISHINLDSVFGCLGLHQGLMLADHQLPADALVFEMKTCENCGGSFMRHRNGGTQPFVIKDYDCAGRQGRYAEKCFGERELRRDCGPRYCIRCQARALAPVELEDYKAQLPGTENQQRGYRHLPKVDHTLDAVMPVPKKLRAPRVSLGDWRSRLRIAFAQHGPLTYEQMRQYTGHSSKGGFVSAMYFFGVELERVGSAWPKPQRGNGLGLYLPVSQGAQA